ncbi:MAG: cyclic pyranopterin monophosphate synthase MoaC [Anaerolineales bacterium]|nr:cyclic pyranopterin monophosphate synthase MoaC [Anaerolineales bacterium]
MSESDELTHLDESGRARMVDVGNKPTTDRQAIARAHVILSNPTLELVKQGDLKRGDLTAVVETAGIMAAKRTSELIPHCHPLPLSHIEVELSFSEELPGVVIEASTRTQSQTGVEMEALTAVSVAALTVYDMVKAVEPSARITDVQLVRKRGGQSGDYDLEAQR